MSIVLRTASRTSGMRKISRGFLSTSPLVLAVATAAVFLAACGASRPIKYYQLTYPTASATTQNALNVALLVRAFDAVNLYKEDRIVYAFNTQEIGTYETQRWIAPPVDLLQSSLIRTLRSSGQFRAVMTARGEGGGDYALSGYLYEFDEVDGSSVVARLNYVVRMRDRKTGTIVWTHTYNHDEPAGEKSVPAVVAAMDRNVQASVQEINASIAAYFQSNPPK